MESRIKNIMASHYFEGAMLLLFGIVMLLWPSAAKKCIGVIIGIILVVIGLILTIDFLRKFGAAHPMSLFAGLLSFALGIEMIVSPSTFIVVVQVVMSITLIYSSILLNLQAYKLRSERNALFYLTVTFAIMALAFAAVILIKPLGEGIALIRVKGASLILEGLAALFVIKNHSHSGSESYIDV